MLSCPITSVAPGGTVDLVGGAVDAAFGPQKLKYEIHGNTIPHLHLHLCPRNAGDRFEGRPIDRRETELRPAERERLKALADDLRRMG